MKAELERFIRGLAEREHDAAAPETLQDLGTFVHWLIERLGFCIHIRAFKHQGFARSKSAGRLQLGVDILASKEDPDGRPQLHRFVLKQGPVTKSVWGNDAEEGNIVHDVRLAAGRSRKRDAEDAGLGEDVSERVVVVAIHNGDFDVEALGASLLELQTRLAKNNDVELLWWDAGALVELATPLLSTGQGGEKGVDAGLFPPGIRPFVRLALDSLRRDPFTFDLRAVDDYLEERLPLVRRPVREGAAERIEAGEPMNALELRRRAAEVPLFSAMVAAESGVEVGGLTLPTLDALEHCICRVAEHAQRHEIQNRARHLKAVDDTLEALVRQYIRAARSLLTRLEPLFDLPYGLAVASTSETVDYPLRCLRLLGYLAVAGLACLELGEQDQARLFADGVSSLWRSNDAGCESPVTDDQGIELSAVWLLLLRLDRGARAGEMASSLVNRLIARRLLGLPLPGLYQRAGVPMSDRDLRSLATAHGLGLRRAPGFEQGGSTLLALAVYVAYRHGAIEPEHLGRLHGGMRGANGEEKLAPCFLQLWQPPIDAPREWYAHTIEYRGLTWVFDNPEVREGFLAQFHEHAKTPEESYARRIGLLAVDFIAWKRWRTLPDASLFL